MRILVDLQGAQNNSKDRGIGRYCLQLAKGMVRNRGRHEVFVLVNALFPAEVLRVRNEMSGLIPDSHIVVFTAAGPVDEMSEKNTWRCQVGELLYEKMMADIRPDVLVITSLFEGGYDNTITSIGRISSEVPTAVVMYDLIPYLDPEQYLGDARSRQWYYRKIDTLRRAKLLLAISDSACNEALTHLKSRPDQVVTISSAADESFGHAHLDSKQVAVALKDLGVSREFLMHSSAFDPRKNFEGLIRAFALLPPTLRQQYQLVLVCKLGEAQRAGLLALAEAAGIEEGSLVLTGYISDDQLIALYSACHLFVFPSLHEGFGLPILEAMSCGCPAIGSDSSSIPEVIGRADALFDPTRPASIAVKIEQVLTDREFWLSLKAHAAIQSRKYSWDRTALIALSALERFDRSDSSLTAPVPDSLNGDLTEVASLLHTMRNLGAPSSADLEATANAIVENQDEALRVRATAQFNGALTWRVEGPFDSSYSLALLNRETARALARLGHHVVLHSTEGPGDFPANDQFLAQNPDLGVMHALVGQYPHDKVDVVSRNLYPPRVGDMAGPLNILHHYAWEESGFPPKWVDDFNENLTGITCLSEHVQKVLLDNGVSVQMATSGCGVDHWERVEVDTHYAVSARTFRLLHVSSCFPRKGVEAMLDAYGMAFTIDDDVSLVIKTFKNPHNEIHRWLDERKSASADYPHVVVLEEDFSDSVLKSIYQQCQVLVAPSCAEGFGLPMAEAMLSGLPVITTAWSGQLDFCNSQNAWLVDYNFEPAKTHFELPGSVWAAVNPRALASAMRSAYAALPERRAAMAAEGRKLLLKEFTWDRVAARAVNAALAWRQPAAPKDVRIGWVSTWNTKCGIATYSQHLVEHIGHDLTILAPREESLSPDAANCVRCWRVSKEANSLDDAAAEIAARRLNTIVIQFNYGFFDFKELSHFINYLVDSGRIVIVMLHSTIDPAHLATDPRWLLATARDAFARCHRILAHTVADLNRLKALSLVDNVALFPHGVGSPPPSDQTEEPKTVPVIATYGFCLPHKGLPEIVRATALLRDSGIPVKLNLINAIYPDPISEKLAESLRALVRELALEDTVEFQFDFLPDAESLRLLRRADLLVFAYQHTGESASGAVRIGLTSGVPTAVTPLAIFDDVQSITITLPGIQPQAIADGIASALKKLRNNDPDISKISARRAAWTAANSYAELGKRLRNMTTGLLRLRRDRGLLFYGSSKTLRSQVGIIQGEDLVSTGVDGFLLFGPYVRRPAGRHHVKLWGSASIPEGSRAYLDVSVRSGDAVIGRTDLTSGFAGAPLVGMEIFLDEPCEDLEVRVWVDSRAEVRVSRLELSVD